MLDLLLAPTKRTVWTPRADATVAAFSATAPNRTDANTSHFLIGELPLGKVDDAVIVVRSVISPVIFFGSIHLFVSAVAYSQARDAAACLMEPRGCAGGSGRDSGGRNRGLHALWSQGVRLFGPGNGLKAFGSRKWRSEG